MICPWGPFEAKDGYVALIVPTQAMWIKFCKAIKREDLINDTLDSGPKRAANIEMLMPVIKGWMADKTKNEVCDILMAAGLPCTGTKFSGYFQLSACSGKRNVCKYSRCSHGRSYCGGQSV